MGAFFQGKDFSLGEKVAPLVGRAFPIAEIYDTDRHWELYARKEPFLNIEIARGR